MAYHPLDIQSHVTAERTANDYKAIAETMKSLIKCYINMSANHKYIFRRDNQEIRLGQLQQLEDKTCVCAPYFISMPLTPDNLPPMKSPASSVAVRLLNGEIQIIGFPA